jgi:hypothetical protein
MEWFGGNNKLYVVIGAGMIDHIKDRDHGVFLSVAERSAIDEVITPKV